MKAIWPDVVDTCGDSVGYHGACEARIGRMVSAYSGTCDSYCSTFGFECAGGRKVGAESGCAASGEASEYLSCADRVTDEEAICSCRDPHDTFLWRGASETCGAGRALVQQSAAATCSEFCSAQGLACTNGEAVAAEGCAAKGVTQGCDARLAASGFVCECAGEYDRSGAFAWPDKLELCAASAVLVSGTVLKEQGGTCDGYCEHLRSRVPDFPLYFSCYAAWPAQGLGCGAYKRDRNLRGLSSFENCLQDFRGADAVCACSFADL